MVEVEYRLGQYLDDCVGITVIWETLFLFIRHGLPLITWKTWLELFCSKLPSLSSKVHTYWLYNFPSFCHLSILYCMTSWSLKAVAFRTVFFFFFPKLKYCHHQWNMPISKENSPNSKISASFVPPSLPHFSLLFKSWQPLICSPLL